LGDLLKDIDKLDFKTISFNIIIIVTCVVFSLITTYFNSNINVRLNELGNYLLFYLGGVFGSLIFIFISKIISTFKILEIIGRNTLSIYALNEFIPLRLNYLGHPFGNGLIKKAITFCVLLMIIFIKERVSAKKGERMFHFLIRLDDACPTMNSKSWEKIEKILQNYSVCPIVGVIPDCLDKSTSFQNKYDDSFWTKVLNWQINGWTIFIHGYHHKLNRIPNGTKTFFKNVETHSEFVGLSVSMQRNYIRDSIRIFKEHKIAAKGFFAPGHTFDANTVSVLAENGINYISDGYDIKPFIKCNVTFIPTMFDTPRKMPYGLFTFVFHPSSMKENDYLYLDNFLKKYSKHCISFDESIQFVKGKQSLFGRFCESIIFLLRKLRRRK